MTQLVKIDQVAQVLTMGCEVETLVQCSSPYHVCDHAVVKKGLDQKDIHLLHLRNAPGYLRLLQGGSEDLRAPWV